MVNDEKWHHSPDAFLWRKLAWEKIYVLIVGLRAAYLPVNDGRSSVAGANAYERAFQDSDEITIAK